MRIFVGVLMLLCAVSAFGQGKLMHDGAGAPTGTCSNAKYIDTASGLEWDCIGGGWVVSTRQLLWSGQAGSGIPFAVLVNNTILSAATGKVFASPGNIGTPLTITTEGNVSFPITRAGTIRNLYARTGGTAKVNTPATTITIRKNGVDTSVTLVLTQTVNTTTSDTTHSFTVVAGDLITVSFVTTGTTAVSVSIASVSFELD